MNENMDASDKLGYLAAALSGAKIDMAVAHHRLFSADNREILRDRVERMVRQLVRGTNKPTTCGETMSIPWSIADKGFKVGVYPASAVDWGTSGLNIVIGVTAVFRGEEDSQYEFAFPADHDEFERYLAGLERAGDERAAADAARLAEKAKLREAEERRMFERLKGKFGTEGRVSNGGGETRKDGRYEMG